MLLPVDIQLLVWKLLTNHHLLYLEQYHSSSRDRGPGAIICEGCSMCANNPLNAAQTEMHAVVRGGAVAE